MWSVYHVYMIFEKEEAAQSRRNTEKLLVMRALLSSHDSVFMHFKPATFGADMIIPPHLRGQTQVVFQVGLSMPVPISDLKVDDEGFSGTLSFKGKPYTCYVPWRAVFALVGADDQRGRVWPEDMPEPIVKDVLAEERRKDFKVIDGDDLESKKTLPYVKPVGKRERPDWMRVIDGEKKD